MTTDGLDLATMIMGLGGGLAIFLYGMRKMTDSLKTVAGGRLKDLLSKLATNRFTGVLSGALITSIIQSSSVTTVMVVQYQVAIELVDNIKRIHSLARRIAKVMIDLHAPGMTVSEPVLPSE